jgi:hypothetical protein
MAGITERNQMKNELIGMGYSLKYIDEWQPKTKLYRHKAAYNSEGTMMEGVGTFISNVPGNPDYVLRKAQIGLFPWTPSDSCSCRWCAERNPASQPVAPSAEKVMEKVVEEGRSPRRGNRRVGPYYKAS